MLYLVRIGRRGYLARGKLTRRRECATVYSSPSAARAASAKLGARLGACTIIHWSSA